MPVSVPDFDVHPRAKVMQAFKDEKHTFYILDSFNLYSNERKIPASMMLQTLSLNIFPDDLANALEAIVDTMKTVADVDSRNARIKLLSPAITLAGEMTKRLHALPMPKIIFRLYGILFFEEGENPNIAPGPDVIEARMEYFWSLPDDKKKELLKAAYSRPMSSIVGMPKPSETASLESLMSQMIVQQVIADWQNTALSQGLEFSPGNLF